MRALGVTSPQRWPGFPDIPAIAETVPGFESVGFYGISAPKGTPPEIVDTLNKAVGEALKDPKIIEQLTTLGGIPKPMTPAEFGKLVATKPRNGARWSNSPALRWIRISVIAGPLNNPSSRANGSRECAPGDRLREAIQFHAEDWIASSLCAPLRKRFAFVAGNDDTG